MELRKGFRKTEVGQIPEDWTCEEVGSLGRIIRGASPRPKGDPRYYGGNIPRLMVEDVTRDGKFVTPKIDFLTEEGAKKSRPCPKGTITIVCSGTVGVTSFLAVDACIHDGFLALTELSKNTNSDYLYHQFCILREKFDNSATHGGVFTNLTTSGVKEFKIALPATQSEQTAIANALSDADALISSLRKLIAKKRQIKQGAMQTLLNPHENGVLKNGWSFFRLGDLCECQNGTSLERFFNDEDGLKVISIGNYSAFGRFVNTGTYIDRKHFKEVAKYVLQKNDLAMTMNDKTSVGTIIGRVLLIESDNTYVYNQRTMRLRCRESMIPSFAFHLINSDRIHKKMVNLAKPGTQIYINTDDIVLLELEVPDRANQIRIAAILDSMDDEIAALESKLAKYQQIKQGMMQNLLTGRIRLV